LADLEEKLAIARTDGSASVSRLQPEGLEIVREWTEPRLKTGQRYVGLAASSSAYVVPSKAFFLGLFWAYHLAECILALRMAPSASHHLESPMQNPGPQLCPCVCVNGAWHLRGRLSPTGGTKSNSPSGTSRPPLHHNSRPSRTRPHPLIPKPLPRNGNVEMTSSLASYGEQKMHVVLYVHHSRWAHTHLNCCRSRTTR
jgi:hypothetical protein